MPTAIPSHGWRSTTLSLPTCRAATARDIPQLAKIFYELKSKTAFASLPFEWSVEACAAHLMRVLYDTSVYIAVEETDGEITACCGVTLYRDFLPPHPLEVGEWLWWGKTKKAAARILSHAGQWGKARGAVIMRYALNSESTGGHGKYSERNHWRLL